MPLSPEQSLAVETFDRNILLLAAAGTGKTFTVANKVAAAIKRGIAPSEILCLTFTVKAQEEIKNDVLKYCGENGVRCFTIHGFCYRLIKDYLAESGEGEVLSVADDVDEGELLKRLADGMIAEKSDLPDDLTLLGEKDITKIVSEIKREKDALGFPYSSEDGYGVALAALLNKQSFVNLFTTRKQNSAQITDYNFLKLLRTRGKEFCLRYSRLLRSSNLVDFDDLLYRAKELTANGEVDLNAYKLIVTDEVQDTNLIEYRIIEKFFDNATVMLCGDENQTIYTWRGSAPDEIISEFKAKYSPLEIRLTKNRRATELLTQAAEGYLNNASGVTYSPTTKTPDGEKITVKKCSFPFDEAERIFDEIKNYSGDKAMLCVMARSNRYVTDLYKRLSRINANEKPENRIPFFTADADQQFYKKPIIKDFLAFLRLSVNPEDVSSLERICKRRLKGVKTNLVSAIEGYGSAGISVSAFTRKETYDYGDPFAPLISAYENGEIVVYDLETTGANPYDDLPIQISAIKLGLNGVSDELNLFVIPEKEISLGALSTHGYSAEYISAHGGLPLNAAIERFSAFTDGCVTVGHNSAAFDDLIIDRSSEKYNLALSVKARYDTLTISKTFFKSENNYKLSTLCEKFGIKNERAHDAFADVSATAALLVKILDDYLIPSVALRKTLISSNLSAFKGFYEDLTYYKKLISEGRLRDALKAIADRYGLIDESSRREDRESANELYVSLKPSETSPRPLTALEDLLSNVTMSGSQLDLIIKKLKKVPVLTIHQSKGCEFDEVIFAGVAENEIPTVFAVRDGNEDEEKRVFYVALTRAKKKLVITYPSVKQFGVNEYPRSPSPYISLIPKEFIEEK